MTAAFKLRSHPTRLLQMLQIATMSRAVSSASRLTANALCRKNLSRCIPCHVATRSFGSDLGKGISVMEEDFFDKASGKRRIQVKAYGQTSFRLDETLVPHSVLLLPHSFFIWNAKTFEDINIESLALFPFVFPTLEILFIGCGETQPKQLPLDLIRHFRAKGIVVEATSTANAASSFNVHNAEGRHVGAALLTLEPTMAVFRIPGEFV